MYFEEILGTCDERGSAVICEILGTSNICLDIRYMYLCVRLRYVISSKTNAILLLLSTDASRAGAGR